MYTPAIPRPLIEDLRALPRAFWVLFAGTFINRFGTFVMPFLIIYLTGSGYTRVQAAWAVTAFGIGGLMGTALGGHLADRIGRKNTILAGTAASAVFYVLLYVATGFPAIVTAAVMAGLGAGTYPPASQALLADVVPEARRVRAYSALRLALNAGFACGAATAAFLAKFGFVWLFVGDAITTFLYGILAWLALPHGLRGQTKKASSRLAWSHIAGNGPFLALFAATLCGSLIFSNFNTTYSQQVMVSGASLDLLGFQLTCETLFGLLLSWNGLLVVLAELPLTGITQRFNPRYVMALGYILMGGGFMMNIWGYSFWLLWLAMTIFTAGEMIAMPVSSAYVARLAPEQMRGRYMGTLGLSWSIASIVGPQMGLRLFDVWHPMPWIVCGGLGLLGSIILQSIRPSPETGAVVVEAGAAVAKAETPGAAA